jgi:hypothetical protein
MSFNGVLCEAASLQRVEFNSINLGTAFIVRCIVKGNGTIYGCDDSSLRGYFRVNSEGVLSVRNSSTTTTYTFDTGVSFLDTDPFRLIEVYRSGGNTTIYVDGDYKGFQNNFSNFNLANVSTKMNLACLYRTGSATDYYSTIEVAMLEFSAGTTPVMKLDAQVAGGTGSIMKDTVGSNDGTLINSPTWTTYDSELIAFGFQNLGSLEVPSLGGSTASDLPLVVRYEDFTTAMLNSIDVGGGGLAFSEDELGDSRAPIQIGSFDKVAGDYIKVLTPSVAAGIKLHVWHKSGISQPAIDEPYGTQAVNAGRAFSFSFDEASGNPVDHANGIGNYNGGNTPTRGGASKMGSNFRYANGGLLSNDSSTLSPSGGYSFSTLARFTSISNWGPFFRMEPSLVLQRWSSNDAFQIKHNSNGAYPNFDISDLNTGEEVLARWDWDGSIFRFYLNGVFQVSKTRGSNPNTGAWSLWYQDSSTNVDLYCSETNFQNDSVSADYAYIEAQNQLADGAWWISADVGGTDQQISPVLSGGGSQNISFDITKLIASISSGNGTPTGNTFSGRLVDTSITSGGTVTASAIQGLLISIVSTVSAGGNVTNILEVDKLLQLLNTSGGNVTSDFTTGKVTQLSTTANGQVSLSTEIGKMLPAVVSGNGTIEQLIKVSSSIVSTVTGSGLIGDTTSVAKQLDTLVSAGGSVETIALQLAGTLSTVSGGGTVSNFVTYNKNSILDCTGSGVATTLVEVGKTLEPLIAASGLVDTNIAKMVSLGSTVQANGTLVLSVSKETSITSFIEANGLASSLVNISKAVQTNESANTSGILVDFSKGVRTATTVGAAGNLVSSVSINSNILTVVSSGGEATTITLGNFTDTNIIYITVSAMAEDNSLTLVSVAGDVVIRGSAS